MDDNKKVCVDCNTENDANADVCVNCQKPLAKKVDGAEGEVDGMEKAPESNEDNGTPAM